MKLKLSILLIFPVFFTFAQTSDIQIQPHIRLPQDSLVSQQLVHALNGFLAASAEPNEDNPWVLESQRIETHILLDEFKDIEKSQAFADNHFYQPYLNNVVELNENQYLIQLSYIGTKDTVSHLRASYELIAHRSGDSFKFSSPLIYNTRNWKTAEINNNIFHYANHINEDNLQAFGRLAHEFDEKLKIENKITEFYCTENLTTLLKLMGVNYRLDYNGVRQANFSSSLENKKLIILGNNNATFDNLDAHDLWHDRLSLKISRRKVNKPVDEACAYLYGGSWGLTWEEIFDRFYAQVASDKKTNWMQIKEEPVNFGESRATHLMADYVVNALVIQKIEKEQGFEGVWQMLNCGPFEKGNANYYSALEQLTGISKANYNKAVWKLIKEER
ncbi:MAG: hypothetical protein R8N23_08305 [Reichenbachiella sp.]|uniref:hypothetical protein n=1 Tax=Reichenbachiella sp. TaxID=2184521 RepID=UPI00296657D6|nr:hypothetical protein [Reichenbachiella sp.]MDW3209855.1 hypothetical protein [Reichenbachiella sp.]